MFHAVNNNNNNNKMSELEVVQAFGYVALQCARALATAASPACTMTLISVIVMTSLYQHQVLPQPYTPAKLTVSL
jgi:hypothetical protein